MFTKSKQRVFIPMMLMGFLCFGAAAAEARDYHRSGDQVKKDAVIGAAVGTIVQILGGRTEGHELLKGAVVGGTLGAAVGAAKDSRRGYYRDGYSNQGGYYSQDGYYNQDGNYNRDGYYDRNGGYQDGYYQDGHSRDGYDSRDGYYRDSNRDSRYDRRSSHRHSSRCDHR
jgi:hypothetical protein